MFTPTWLLEKEFRFEAAHHLPHHDGKCQRYHGHSWKGRVRVSSTSLQPAGPKSGMVCDYADIKKALTPILDTYLDHYDLNETLGLENPTSEEIARWLYRKLIKDLPGLVEVVIEETCTSACTYTERTL